MGAADPGAVLVRRAVVEDAEAIAVLQDIANEGHLAAHDWAEAGRDWRDVGAAIIASNATEMGVAATIVAERDGAVVGMLNYADNDDTVDAPDDAASRPFLALRARLAPCLYLRAIAVPETERGSGVGGKLLDVALAAARAAGQAVGVIVHEGNAGLIGHYERRGFARVATEPVIAHHSYPEGSLLIGLRLQGTTP